MTFPSGMHLHTCYGDGQNTPEEMVLAALERDFISVGISEHAYAPYDTACCVPENRMEEYRSEVYKLKEKYAGKIEVYAGIEVDAFHLHDPSQWDYVVGSVHYVRNGAGKYYPIDHRPDIFKAAIDDVGGGSVQLMLERYCETLTDIALSYRPDILGHIDVVTKLNAGGQFFDTESAWYLGMWKNVIQKIATSGCIVEVNTGAMSRGYTEKPYPGYNLLRMLLLEGVPLTLSSDAHCADTIDYAFPQALNILRDAGFSSIKIMRGGQFSDFMLS